MTDYTRVSTKGGFVTETGTRTVVNPRGGFRSESVTAAFDHGTFNNVATRRLSAIRGGLIYEDSLRTIFSTVGKGFISFVGSTGPVTPPPSGTVIYSLPDMANLYAGSAGLVNEATTLLHTGSGTLSQAGSASMVADGVVQPPAPAGSTVVFRKGVSVEPTSGVSIDKHTLTPAPGDTYTVTVTSTVSQDDTDSPNQESYNIT